MSIPAICHNAHYLFEDGVLEFDSPVEIHVTRFGENMTKINTDWVSSYPNYDISFINPDSYSVFINCNEPISSPHREENLAVIANHQQYDLILTSDKDILEKCPNAVLFPYGTTWLNKGRIDHENSIGHYSPIIDELHKDKKFEVSFLSSFHSRNVEGYHVRKDLWIQKESISIPKLFYSSPRMILPNAPDWYIERIAPFIENPLPEDKKEILFNSQFHVSIESTRFENYFTEKLIDALITKTVPIYWGCTNIQDFFNPNGIIQVSNTNDMIIKINSLTPETYENMLPHIEENFERAKEYAGSFAERVKEKILEDIPKGPLPPKSKKKETDKEKVLNIDDIEKELTIGILSLTERENTLNNLLNHLNRITADNNRGKVEIVVNVDSGEKSVGQKRNEVLEHAKGKFVCYIDDDDMVDENYINIILNTIEENSDLDCIGFSGMYYVNGNPTMLFKHANEYGGHYKDEQGVQHRPVNHLNPVRTELAQQIKFPEKNFGEDSDYCDRLLESGLVKNEVVIDKVMYHYYWNSELTRTH